MLCLASCLCAAPFVWRQSSPAAAREASTPRMTAEASEALDG